MSSHLIGYITHEHIQGARTLAKKLLDAKLIACCNLVPQIESHYMWEGKMVQDNEVLMIIKTRRECQDAIISLVQKEHGYSNPEIIFADITAGSKQYLDWVDEVTDAKSQSTNQIL